MYRNKQLNRNYIGIGVVSEKSRLKIWKTLVQKIGAKSMEKL